MSVAYHIVRVMYWREQSCSHLCIFGSRPDRDELRLPTTGRESEQGDEKGACIPRQKATTAKHRTRSEEKVPWLQC